LDKALTEKLLNDGLIEKFGKTKRQQIRLSKSYYSFTNQEADYTKNTPIDEVFTVMKITQHLKSFGRAKMGKFVELFEEQLTRDQVKTIIYKLSDPEVKYLEYTGRQTGREYFLGKSTVNGSRLIERALQIGIEELKKRGELNIMPNKTDVETNGRERNGNAQK
jgi:hypothetical protein